LPPEEPRPHDVRISAEGQARSAELQHCRVAELQEGAGQRGAGEGGQEEVLDELCRQSPATAMAHDDVRVVAKRQRA